jgi:hypothetical protein
MATRPGLEAFRTAAQATQRGDISAQTVVEDSPKLILTQEGGAITQSSLERCAGNVLTAYDVVVGQGSGSVQEDSSYRKSLFAPDGDLVTILRSRFEIPQSCRRRVRSNRTVNRQYGREQTSFPGFADAHETEDTWSDSPQDHLSYERPRLSVAELTGSKLIQGYQSVLRRENGFESCQLCLHRRTVGPT